ncbi:MAG: sigma factor-like helix-turn-helix DNA-binding protein [Deltaproteobacteria bacterium]|nr:sigma factor-like helix-turn-helix DNA-binding protein [Deltaproteobacteria bacterium]
MAYEEIFPMVMDGKGPVMLQSQLASISSSATATAVEMPFDEDEDEDGSRRRDRVRARTISIKRLSKRELERGRQLYPEAATMRPAARLDCAQGEYADRPCPFVSCKFHLYLDVSERTGAIKLNFPDLEVWDLPESCALDIADRGGITLEEVGVIMNLTRERIRQLETKGLAKLRALSEMAALQDYCD